MTPMDNLYKEIRELMDGYILDPADSPFQRGYLAATLYLAKVAEIEIEPELDAQLQENEE